MPLLLLDIMLIFSLVVGNADRTDKKINLNAKEIVEKADKKRRGDTSQAEMSITIVRPTWSREMRIKAWSKDTEFSLILITEPARDRGTVFLKRKKEIWNWIPSIDRNIKLPPSMMMQSWMGSDFTNDDLIINYYKTP